MWNGPLSTAVKHGVVFFSDTWRDSIEIMESRRKRRKGSYWRFSVFGVFRLLLKLCWRRTAIGVIRV
jgi:hypothetical protein